MLSPNNKDVIQIGNLFYRNCIKCGRECIRKKKSETKKWKFCSRTCAVVYRNKERPLKPVSGYKTCMWCKKEFPFRNSLKVRNIRCLRTGITIGSVNQKFCSRQCGLEFKNKYHNPASTPEGRRKISESAKKRGTAHMQTPEAREKQRKTISGSGHWNWKGNKTHPSCLDCGISITFRKKHCKPCGAKHMRGENAPNWKGGLTKKNKVLRGRSDTKAWRIAVFERDDYTCQMCGIRGGELNADHIKPWAYFPELRHELSNGRTLCVSCHKTTDSYMGRATKNYAEKI